MPRVAVPVTISNRAAGKLLGASGTEIAGDATNNHEVVNDGRTLIYVRNAAATPRIVTFIVQATVDGLAVTNNTETIGASEQRSFGPFPVDKYNVAGSALMQIDVAHTDLKLQAESMGI